MRKVVGSGMVHSTGRTSHLVARSGEEDETKAKAGFLVLDAQQLNGERDHASPPLDHTGRQGSRSTAGC